MGEKLEKPRTCFLLRLFPGCRTLLLGTFTAAALAACTAAVPFAKAPASAGRPIGVSESGWDKAAV